MLLGTSAVEMDLSGPLMINGDLTLANADMISLTSTSIASISGTFALNNVTFLSALDFESLTSVGSLQIQTAPALSVLGFDNGLSSAETVIIQNTHLGSLDGIALTEVTDLAITNNGRLDTVDIPLVNITGSLQVIENGQRFDISFPDLIAVNNLAISNASGLKLPSLQSMRGSARLDTNYFTSISAPVLQTCGGGLSILNSPDLESISLPQLSSISESLLISNNSRMSALDGLDNLQTISNDVAILGNMTK